MIELVIADACIGCDKCVAACPTNVFDSTESGVPVIARQSDCQTCFMCEAYCPTDALYVSPSSSPLPDSEVRDVDDLVGSYRAKLGWGKGRTPGSVLAVGPELPHGAPPERVRTHT
ncbi:ferredoxin [Gordonia spumicola]|uniref:Ferredoxin n=1 Tax=Gordonia spumicola TaxID=589161 RepID=A0A7I9V929_9ACTN|nr:ferredoxin family protein [Gordonia spumicola]GEE01898.1 ferredoxin [Gordonia spumicola]